MRPWCNGLPEAMALSHEAKNLLSRDGPRVQAPTGIPRFCLQAKKRSIVACIVLVSIVVAAVCYTAFRHPPRTPPLGIPAPAIGGAAASDVAVDRACLGYAAPPHQVVYEEEPVLVTRYLDEGGEWVDLSRASNRYGVPAARRVPACWLALCRTTNATPLGPAAAIVFLHERRTPAGVPELVVVAYDGRMRLPWAAAGGWTISSIGLSASVKSPAVPDPPLPAWHGEARRLDAEPFVAMYPLRLYAGQPDPADPTHFTIRYELENRPPSTALGTVTSTSSDTAGTIDGWVLDSAVTATSQPAGPAGGDAPVVKFTIRDGRAKLTREQFWSPEEILRNHRDQGLREGKRSWGVWTGD